MYFENKKRVATATLKKSDPDWIRTNDLLLRRQLLYPAELPSHLFWMANLRGKLFAKQVSQFNSVINLVFLVLNQFLNEL